MEGRLGELSSVEQAVGQSTGERSLGPGASERTRPIGASRGSVNFGSIFKGVKLVPGNCLNNQNSVLHLAVGK